MAALASNLIKGIADALKVIGSAVKGIAKAFDAVKRATTAFSDSKISKLAAKLMGPCMTILTVRALPHNP